MARVRPKLATIISEGDFSKWLAETIQEKAAKENAGFVQVERYEHSRDSAAHLVVRSVEAPVVHTITLDTKRA